MRLPIAFALVQQPRTVAHAFRLITSRSHIIRIARARSVHTDAMTGTIAMRFARRTTVHRVGDIKAGHIVRIVAEEMQQHRTGMSYHFGNASYRVILSVHDATACRDENVFFLV